MGLCSKLSPGRDTEKAALSHNHTSAAESGLQDIEDKSEDVTKRSQLRYAGYATLSGTDWEKVNLLSTASALSIAKTFLSIM